MPGPLCQPLSYDFLRVSAALLALHLASGCHEASDDSGLGHSLGGGEESDEEDDDEEDDEEDEDENDDDEDDGEEDDDGEDGEGDSDGEQVDAGEEPGGEDAGPGEEPDASHEVDAVGALVDPDQRVFCTGALLSADTILTAAHCVAQDGVVRWPWGFFLGADVTLGGQFVRVLDGAVHPDYDPFLHAADLAVLRIAGAQPRGEPFHLDGAVPPVGGPVRIFGFGSGAVGPRRRDAEVTETDADQFRYQPGTCPGDSGGPVLVGDGAALAGVVSTGEAVCGSARAVAVAPHATWITEATEFLDPAACRAGDGVCGEACRLGDLDCPCADDDGACRLCAGTDRDCAGACEADGVCATACLAPDPDCRTLQEGAVCERGVECASSVCADGVCREPCAASTGTGCPPWAECQPAGDSAGVCIPYSDARVLGGCAAAPPTSGAAAALALLLSVVVAARRRG
jgi:Trypsin